MVRSEKLPFIKWNYFLPLQFLLKRDIFQIAQKLAKYFGYYYNKKCPQGFFKDILWHGVWGTLLRSMLVYQFTLNLFRLE